MNAHIFRKQGLLQQKRSNGDWARFKTEKGLFFFPTVDIFSIDCIFNAISGKIVAAK